MRLSDNCDNLSRHLGSHRHRSTLGNLVIKLLVERGSTYRECVTGEIALLYVLNKLLGAISRVAIRILKERLDNRALRILSVNYLGHLVFKSS